MQESADIGRQRPPIYGASVAATVVE